MNIFTSLWIEARDLGILPLKDPLEVIGGGYKDSKDIKFLFEELLKIRKVFRK